MESRWTSVQARRFVGLLTAPALLLGVLLGSGVGIHAETNQFSEPGNHRYDQRPPLAHTGGFGEPTCHACHFGGPVNGGPGTLGVVGLPDTVEADRTYRLTVSLADSMQKGGFMLSIRGSDGGQAGRLVPADSARVTVRSPASSSVQYAHHTLAGTRLTSTNEISWSMEWTAPQTSRDSVLVHVAANAANDDASEFGDDVYTHTARTVVRK